MRTNSMAAAAAAVLVATALAAPTVLAQDSDDETMTEPMGSEVGVRLQEWAVIPESQSLTAGSITFNVENTGPEDPHELVIVKTDLPADALPTREDGAVDENGEGIEFVGEIEEFDPGTSESGTFELPAGNYVFLCNLVEEEDGGLEAHYQQGMYISVSVT